MSELYKSKLLIMLKECVVIKEGKLYLDCELTQPITKCEYDETEITPTLNWKKYTKFLPNPKCFSESEICTNLTKLNEFRFRYACYLLYALAEINGQIIEKNMKIYDIFNTDFTKDALKYYINDIGNVDGSTTLQSDIDVTVSSSNGFCMQYGKIHADFFNEIGINNATLNNLDEWFDMNIYFVNFHHTTINTCNKTTLAWSMLRLIQYTTYTKYDFSNVQKCILNQSNNIELNIKSSIQSSLASFKMHIDIDWNNNFISILKKFYQNTDIYMNIVEAMLRDEYKPTDISDIQNAYDLSLATYTSKDQYYTCGSYKHIVCKGCGSPMQKFEYIQSAFENLGFLCEYLHSKSNTEYCHDEETIHLKCSKYLERIFGALGGFFDKNTVQPYSPEMHQNYIIFSGMNRCRQKGIESPRRLKDVYLKTLFGESFNLNSDHTTKFTYLQTEFINNLLNAFPECYDFCTTLGGSRRILKRRLL